MSVEYAKDVGPLLAVRNEMPPTPFTRAQARWLTRRLVLMNTGGYEVATNDGPLVRLYHRITRTQAGGAWCAALQMFVLFILGGQNPILPNAYCPNIAKDAEAKGILDSIPEKDDLILFWHMVDGIHRFAHIGYVLDINPDGTLTTLEGNTNTDGSRDGWQACRKTRKLGPEDKVVHWHRLIPE
jgi:hypothetical protein